MHLNDLVAAGPRTQVWCEPMMVHGRFLMNHRKRDEFGKPAGLVLDVPEQIHVFDPVDGCFQMTVHDGRSRGDSKTMSGFDDINPLLDRDTARRYDIADFLVENFRGCTWQGTQTGALE